MSSVSQGHWLLRFTGALVFCLVLPLAASAQENAGQGSLPITIISDRMEGDFRAGVITFFDHVKMVRGDMVLHADQVEVQPKDEGEEIERVVAVGNVRVITGSRSSVSDRVEYIEQSGLLVLTGNAKVSDGKNTIAGPLIRIFLNEDRAEVEGNTVERPKFLFHPDSLKNQKEDGNQ